MRFPAFQPEAENCSRYLFFTGKGGVGKTSLSCATALRLADSGRRVLLVSTDPASNLEEVLEARIGNETVPVAPGLFAMNINPALAAAAYRERVIGPVRGLLPDAVIRSMEEGLSGSCTVEIAAFDEFSGLIGGAGACGDFDHVVFDTAPTGHTLRLMGLAKAWDQFLGSNTSGASCLGPLAGLARQKEVYERTVHTLADPALTTIVLVSRARTSALNEAWRTSRELGELGIRNQQLVVNGIFRTTSPDPAAREMQRREEEALGSGFLSSLPVSELPLQPANILGLGGLRNLLSGVPPQTDEEMEPAASVAGMSAPADLLDTLGARGRGVILTMGKGGVGKTTVAAAIAVGLAARGFPVRLSTTDPAAHLAATLQGEIEGLTLSRIDPVAETAAYREEVLSQAGADLDSAARALLEEDLRSPCTEEIAVFRAFAREVAQGEIGFVVLDTAPTGHTLLLLDASESYHREHTRQSRGQLPDDISLLLPRLRDPEFVSVLIITLPEATPVHEASALQDDLRRAGIEPAAWVANQCLSRLDLTEPLLKARARREIPYLKEIAALSGQRATLIDWQISEPAGTDALARLFTQT